MKLTTKKVEVREQEILEGLAGNSKFCAVALSVNNVLKPGYYCTVTPSLIRIYQEDESYQYDQLIHYISSPTLVRRFVHQYDEHKTVDAIEFDIDIPNSLVKE